MFPLRMLRLFKFLTFTILVSLYDGSRFACAKSLKEPSLTRTHSFGDRYDVLDAPVDNISPRRIGHFYGGFGGGLGKSFVQNSEDQNISHNGGLLLGDFSGTFSINVGFQFEIAKYFNLGVEIAGRWLFFNDILSSTALSSIYYKVENSQMVLLQLKPTFVFNEGRFGLFFIVGLGGYFFTAEKGVLSHGREINFDDFAVSYGLGTYATIHPNISLQVSLFALAPLVSKTQMYGGSIHLQTYGVEFGLRFRM